jgi:hypothetical protein
MADNKNKRCPQCSGDIDAFGSCRRCGREWTETLEPDEQAVGLPEGEQHPAVKKVGKRKSRKTRFTKSKGALQGAEFVTFKSPVPQKYADWMIGDGDDETEIIKKRSLMRLDSRRSYNAMGLSIRAFNMQKGALISLTNLWEFLSEDEQKLLAPTMSILKRAFDDIRTVSQVKIKEAAEMEMALDKAHHSARQRRLKMMDAENRKKFAINIKPGEDTEGFSTPEPAVIDPKLLTDPRLNVAPTKEELLELAKQKLSNLDQEKRLKKRGDRLASEDPTEE